MRLYKTSDAAQGTVPIWTTSQGAASKAKTTMVATLKAAEKPHRGVEFVAVEVPTKKDDLVAFLNTLR